MTDKEPEMLPVYPDFDCFREHDGVPEMIPARSARDWMDATSDRFAYRCTPLSIANASGWELLSPVAFEATWNGGTATADLVIHADDPAAGVERTAVSAFGHGVLTFHTGYLFRTSPGWAVIARGAPNTAKDGIAALEGLIETDWLPLPFTMNWRFIRPGTIRFEKGESFCFLSLVPHAAFDQIQPRIKTFAEAEALKDSYDHWRQDRADFNARLSARDPDTVTEGWQRHYVRGRDPSGRYEPAFHLSKRKMKTPE